jgi:hypothetical protein
MDPPKPVDVTANENVCSYEDDELYIVEEIIERKDEL